VGEIGGDAMRKRTTMKITVLSLLLALVAGSLTASDGDGGYPVAFFQVPIGARPSGMGGAYLAVSNDASGALYNTAGLCSIDRPIFGTSYRALQLDRTLGYATVLFPSRSHSVIGLHWLYAGSGSVRVRDRNGFDLGRDFSVNNHVFGFIFAKKVSDLFSFGTKLNYLHTSFPEVSTYSVSFDFGVMAHLSELINREKRDLFPVQDIQAGLSVKHIAGKYMWNSEKYTQKYTTDSYYGYEQQDKFPIEIGLGVSGKLLKRKLLIATDLRKSEKQHIRFYGGAEYSVTPEFALRTGYSDSRFTAGTGFVFKVAKRSMSINYAFSSDKVEEGSEHIFSFDVLF
jgi:hypothetical protein